MLAESESPPYWFLPENFCLSFAPGSFQSFREAFMQRCRLSRTSFPGAGTFGAEFDLEAVIDKGGYVEAG